MTRIPQKVTPKLRKAFIAFIRRWHSVEPLHGDEEVWALRGAWLQTVATARHRPPQFIQVVDGPRAAEKVDAELSHRIPNVFAAPVSVDRILQRALEKAEAVIIQHGASDLLPRLNEVFCYFQLCERGTPFDRYKFCWNHHGSVFTTHDWALDEILEKSRLEGRNEGRTPDLKLRSMAHFHDLRRCVTLAFLAEYLDLRWVNLDGPLLLLRRASLVYGDIDGAVIARSPLEQHYDQRGRLHRTDGPALVYAGGEPPWYYLEGIPMPSALFTDPESFGPEVLLAIENTEMRRVVMEKLGVERFLEIVRARETAADDYGRLYETDVVPHTRTRPWIKDEEFPTPPKLVRLLNATPEPGTKDVFKEYLLHVPPGIQTPREAVAWSFDVPVDEYAPFAES